MLASVWRTKSRVAGVLVYSRRILASVSAFAVAKISCEHACPSVRLASSVISSSTFDLSSSTSSKRKLAISPTRSPHKCENISIVTVTVWSPPSDASVDILIMCPIDSGHLEALYGGKEGSKEAVLV